jgi:hypothetical protein
MELAMLFDSNGFVGMVVKYNEKPAARAGVTDYEPDSWSVRKVYSLTVNGYPLQYRSGFRYTQHRVYVDDIRYVVVCPD